MNVSQIRERLEKWEAADAAITANKSYSIDGLSVTKQDAATIRQQIEYWSQRLAIALRGGSSFGTRRIRAIDGVRIVRGKGWPH